MTETPPRAKLTPKTNASGTRRDGTPVDVHFNPESLALTIRSAMEAAEHHTTAGRPSQLVASSEVTLAVQLVFDTTMSGDDVRTTTAQIAEMMRPGAVVAREDGKKRPMVVEFAWNAFAFEGILTDYSETLDYFSAEGIPLRSNLNITLTKHEAAFPEAGGGSSAAGAGSAPPTAPVASGESVEQSVARSGSGSDAGKAAQEVASANGVENLKDPGVDELAAPGAAFSAGAAAGAFGSPLSGGGAFAGAGAGISFGAPPAAFASGDAGFGLDLGASAGAGLSLGAGAGAGASLGGGAGVSLGAGAGIGLDEVASFSADGGALELDAFAGLNAPKLEISAGVALGGSIDFELPDAPGLGAGAALGAGVSLGGAATASAGGPLAAGVGGGQVANVGREINLADILFKEED